MDEAGRPGAFDMTSYTSSFASTSVAKKVVAQLRAMERQSVATLLHGGIVGQRAGLLFEQYAHEVLWRKGSYRLRWLGPSSLPLSESRGLRLTNDNDELWLHLDDSSTDVEFDDLTSLPLYVYGRPSDPNFKTVDSALLLDTATLLFQCTISPSHSLTKDGLVEILAALPNYASPNVVLMYVLVDVKGDASVLKSFSFGPVKNAAVAEAVRVVESSRAASSRRFSVYTAAICMSVNHMIELLCGGAAAPSSSPSPKP